MSLAQPHISPPPRVEPGLPTDPIWPLTVAQYHEMIRAGILTDDDRVELLEGLLVAKMPRSPRRTTATKLAERAVERLLPRGWHVRAQGPITLIDSEPEPDVVVARGDIERYADRHPGPKDVAIVIEVAEASLARDRGTKMRAYAVAKLPIYWIVNLPEELVEVYSGPSGPGAQPGYRLRQDYGMARVVPLIIQTREIGLVRVADIIPKRPSRPRRKRTR